jgi:nucleoside-triphosphatase THEP1
VKRRWHEFRAQAKGTEIVIYDEIGAFGISAKAFLEALETVVSTVSSRLERPAQAEHP